MTEITLLVAQNTLFGNQIIQNYLIYGFYADSKKIIAYALGEHDPGSAQDGSKCSL